MFHNKNGLLYSKFNDSNQIELIQIDLNNYLQLSSMKNNQTKVIIIPINSKSRLIKYSFFDEALMVVLENEILFYENYNDKKGVISSSYNFVKEDNSKTKIAQIVPLQKYIVSFGKIIHLIRILNKTRIIIQTYRMQSISIHSILLWETNEDFTGENISLTCRVNYDMTFSSMSLSSSFAIQSFVLPFMENEIIANHQLFFGQSDPATIIKTWALNGVIIIAFSKKGKQCLAILNKINPSRTFELKEIEHCLIDHIALLSLTNHIFVFCDNKTIAIYHVNTSINDIKYINKLDYNKETEYLLKHKALKINGNILLTAFNTINQLKLIALNKEMNNIDKEEYIMKDYFFSLNHDMVVKQINNDYCIKIIKEKHCEVMNTLFYNTMINSIKFIEGLTVIVYSNKIELIVGKGINSKTKPMSIIDYCQKDITILDYDLCFIKTQLFFFVLLIDNNSEHRHIVLFQFNNNHQHPTIIGNKNNKTTRNQTLYFTYSNDDNVTVNTLIDSSKVINNISLISSYHLLIMISQYGEIESYSYDENGSIALLYHFTFSFYNCEITEMKNEFENESDLNNIFRLDSQLHLLSSYIFIDAFVFKETVKTISNETPLFNEQFMIVVVNCGLIIFKLITNTYTGIRKIFFYDQINKESAKGFNRDSIYYNGKSKRFCLK